jgi:transcriptional regulator with XRE-family HTH domain
MVFGWTSRWIVQMDIRLQFGKRIRFLREQQSFTQEELAHRAEMNVTYLSDLERGRWNPTLEKIARLSKALRLSPSALLEGVKLSRSRRRSK